VRSRFTGEICAFGTASGTRIVIGRWEVSPLGSFADVMVERDDGHCVLLAPDERVAEYVSSTYRFDEVDIGPLTARRRERGLEVSHRRLAIDVRIGRRTTLGRLLRLVPRPVAASTAWATAIDPLARIAVRGVRTRGSAGNGRREWYGATDVHRLDAADAELDGSPLGPMAELWPPVRFGFGSAPRDPSIVAITTTIEELAQPSRRGPARRRQ